MPCRKPQDTVLSLLFQCASSSALARKLPQTNKQTYELDHDGISPPHGHELPAVMRTGVTDTSASCFGLNLEHIQQASTR